MNKIYKISDIVRIRSGMVVSKTTNNNEEKLTNTFVRLLVTSDFDDDGNLFKEIQPNAIYKPVFEKNFLKAGEILFNAKGRRFFAMVFNEEFPHCIAGSTFLVLTITSNEVIPNYLLWYLNHEQTLKVFNAKIYTQTLPSVSLKELADLQITVPDLETQNNIVLLDQLKNKKLKIRKQLIELENQYINTLTYKKIKE